MATVEERDAIRLESFLESDRRISDSLRRRFDSGALHPKNVLQCLMACAGPDTLILCGAAFWLAYWPSQARSTECCEPAAQATTALPSSCRLVTRYGVSSSRPSSS